MKIETYFQEISEANDYISALRIDVDGKEKIYVSDCIEPEDVMLGRDLNFVFDIVGLMKKAYDAGKRGEEFELIEKNVENIYEME
jgi:hypothetical protein